MGKKTQQNFLYIDVSKVQRQNPKHVFLFLADMFLSLPCVLYTSECVSNEEHTSSIYTLSSTCIFP